MNELSLKCANTFGSSHVEMLYALVFMDFAHFSLNIFAIFSVKVWNSILTIQRKLKELKENCTFNVKGTLISCI